MAKQSPALRRQRSVLKRFGHLLELTGDIDRNASDRDFLNLGSGLNSRRIYYVFDENLFELFVDPATQPNFCANFYSKTWSERGRAQAKSEHFSAQAGLIAAEYLFSESLPGLNPGDPIFMTEWHYTELRDRMRKLDRDLRAQAATLGGASEHARYLAEATRMAALDGGPEAPDDIANLLEIADPEAASDVRHYLSAVEDGPAARRFLLARELVSSLAGDRIVEPLRQLVRYYTDVLPRLRRLNAQFPMNEREKASLNALVHEWITNLNEHYGKDTRTGRVQFDARSIAYVHWIAKNRLSRDDRIVLVTGDANLFYAYRNWYRHKEIGEAFLLRTVNQYAPLINPHDLPNDMERASSRGYYLFENIQMAIDAPVSTFNIATQAGGREHLAGLLGRSQAPEEEPAVWFFTHRLGEEWWIHRDRGFSDLRNQWRLAERLAIGASLPILTQRLAGRQALLDEIHRGEDGQDPGAAFSRVLKQLLDEIMFKGMQIDIPDAVQYVSAQVADRNGQTPRAPMEIMLKVPVSEGDGPADSIHFSVLMARLEQGDAAAAKLLDRVINGVLRKRPDILFAITAALALRSEAWDQAERFAENALKAAETLHLLEPGQGAPETNAPDTNAPVAKSEYRYLLAIARRFAIASRRPQSTRTGRDPWRADLETSVKDLRELEDLHLAAGQARRRLRAVAEQAAVRLFYAGWGVCAPRPELEMRGYDFGYAVEQLNAALADLRRGLALQDALGDGDAASIRRNLAVNAASLALIGPMLDDPAARLERLTAAELDRIEAELAGVVGDLDAYPKVVALDTLGFLVLVRGRAEFADPLAAIVTGGDLGDLALDRALAAVIARALAHSRFKPQAATEAAPATRGRPAGKAAKPRTRRDGRRP